MGPCVKGQWALVAYAVAVVAITFIHEPVVLAAGLGACLLAARHRAWRLARRTLAAVVVFNLSVSLGYGVLALWQGRFQPETLLLLNLRVCLLVFLGFWLIETVDLISALARFPLLQWVLALAIGQIRTFERLTQDFRLAFASRNPRPPAMLARSRHAAAQAQTLMDKAMASASESALAMRSRGSFDD